MHIFFFFFAMICLGKKLTKIFLAEKKMAGRKRVENNKQININNSYNHLQILFTETTTDILMDWKKNKKKKIFLLFI